MMLDKCDRLKGMTVRIQIPDEGVITSVTVGDRKIDLTDPVKVKKGDDVLVCAKCGQPYTDEERRSGPPKVCPRCGNGKPQADDGSKPEAPFLWNRKK